MRVTLFTEYNDKMDSEEAKASYPEGMNSVLEAFLKTENEVTTIIHSKSDDGSALTDEILKHTDVLVWWGHRCHSSVSDEVVEKVVKFVNCGMGFIALHSAHESKPFRRLVGTSGSLSWRETGEKERVWVIEHAHPITKGIDKYIDIPKEEMYGEPFSIPAPDELLFISWFKGGEVMRSGCVFNRGYGKIFFFRPGHETLPTYSIKEIQRVVLNAVKYVAPVVGVVEDRTGSFWAKEPLEKI